MYGIFEKLWRFFVVFLFEIRLKCSAWKSIFLPASDGYKIRVKALAGIRTRRFSRYREEGSVEGSLAGEAAFKRNVYELMLFCEEHLLCVVYAEGVKEGSEVYTAKLAYALRYVIFVVAEAF